MPAKSKSAKSNPDAPPERQAHASSEAVRKERQSDLLDEALLETFPASDPVSVVRVR